MATAGYDPRAASDLWELMACVEDDAAAMGQGISVENRFTLLRTHPTSDVRLKVSNWKRTHFLLCALTGI